MTSLSHFPDAPGRPFEYLTPLSAFRLLQHLLTSGTDTEAGKLETSGMLKRGRVRLVSRFLSLTHLDLPQLPSGFRPCNNLVFGRVLTSTNQKGIPFFAFGNWASELQPAWLLWVAMDTY